MPNQALVRFDVRMIECVVTQLRMIAGATRRSAAVSYRGVHRESSLCAKPTGQRNLDLWIGRESESRHGDCQHRKVVGGSERRVPPRLARGVGEGLSRMR